MARIKDYQLDRELELQDKVLGTDVTNNGTMNFSLEQLGEFLASRGLAEPSNLDFQFTYAGNTAPSSFQPGEIYFNSEEPASLTEVYISSADLKGIDTGPLVRVLAGTVIELNDAKTSEGTDYGFYNVDHVDTTTFLDGYMIGVSLYPNQASTMSVPQTDSVNLTLVGLAGGSGTIGYTPTFLTQSPAQEAAGEATIRYIVDSDAPADFTLQIPTGPAGTPGAPGVDGNDGAPGAPGTDGTDGAQGPQGIYTLSAFRSEASQPTSPADTTFNVTQLFSSSNGLPADWDLDPSTPPGGEDLYQVNAEVNPVDAVNDIVTLSWSAVFMAGAQGPAGTDGTDGESTYVIYAEDGVGTGQSFAESSTRPFIRFFTSATQPTLPLSSGTWSRYIGTNGTDGSDGTRGSVWNVSTGDPTAQTGDLANDQYLDTDTENIWSYNGTSWVQNGNIGPNDDIARVFIWADTDTYNVDDLVVFDGELFQVHTAYPGTSGSGSNPFILPDFFSSVSTIITEVDTLDALDLLRSNTAVLEIGQFVTIPTEGVFMITGIDTSSIDYIRVDNLDTAFNISAQGTDSGTGLSRTGVIENIAAGNDISFDIELDSATNKNELRINYSGTGTLPAGNAGQVAGYDTNGDPTALSFSGTAGTGGTDHAVEFTSTGGNITAKVNVQSSGGGNLPSENPVFSGVAAKAFSLVSENFDITVADQHNSDITYVMTAISPSTATGNFGLPVIASGGGTITVPTVAGQSGSQTYTITLSGTYAPSGGTSTAYPTITRSVTLTVNDAAPTPAADEYFFGVVTIIPTAFVANSTLTGGGALDSVESVPATIVTSGDALLVNLQSSITPTFTADGGIGLTPDSTFADTGGSGFTTYVLRLNAGTHTIIIRH